MLRRPNDPVYHFEVCGGGSGRSPARPLVRAGDDHERGLEVAAHQRPGSVAGVAARRNKAITVPTGCRVRSGQWRCVITRIAATTEAPAATAANGASFSPRWNALTLEITGTIPRNTNPVAIARAT